MPTRKGANAGSRAGVPRPPGGRGVTDAGPADGGVRNAGVTDADVAGASVTGAGRGAAGGSGTARGGVPGLLYLAAFVAVVVLGVWLLLPPAPSSASVDPGANARPAPTVGQEAPDFTATTLDGRTVSLASLRGTPVWLTFGATWCAPCRVEAPDIEAAHDGRAEILAVYMGEPGATVAPYAQRMGLTFGQIPDADGQLSALYGVRGIPVHYFVDAEGVVRSTRVGILGPETIDAELAAIQPGA
nr:TlpA disulfide reductase family protein [Propioniciclava soli]